MENSIENFKFLSDEELSTLSFWELAIYMDQLNDVEKVYKASLERKNVNTPTNNVSKDGVLDE
mgnify:CR=1 FL=1